MSTVRIAIRGCRPTFVRRARWILEELARAVGRDPVFVDGEADITYGPDRPATGIWIPMQHDAQAFFEGPGAFPGESVHHAGGLTLLRQYSK